MFDWSIKLNHLVCWKRIELSFDMCVCKRTLWSRQELRFDEVFNNEYDLEVIVCRHVSTQEIPKRKRSDDENKTRKKKRNGINEWGKKKNSTDKDNGPAGIVLSTQNPFPSIKNI